MDKELFQIFFGNHVKYQNKIYFLGILKGILLAFIRWEKLRWARKDRAFLSTEIWLFHYKLLNLSWFWLILSTKETENPLE